MKLVVRRRHPALATLLVLAFVGALGAVAWWYVDEGRARALAGMGELREERDALQRAREGLVREREALARRLAILERERQVEQSAYRKVDAELQALQLEILDLKEELAFYRGIVADNSAGGGVRIQRFVVEPDSASRDYVFRLVLTRGMRSDNVATGAVTLDVDGDRDGQPLRLGLEELSPFPVTPLKFRFRHFQRIEGRLRLPERFTPHQVVVQVVEGDGAERPTRQTYAWPSTQGSASS